MPDAMRTAGWIARGRGLVAHWYDEGSETPRCGRWRDLSRARWTPATLGLRIERAAFPESACALCMRGIIVDLVRESLARGAGSATP